MEPEKISRISELTKLSRERALTPDEEAERAALRREYIDGYRAHMEEVLQHVRIQETDGTLHPLKRKDGAAGQPDPQA